MDIITPQQLWEDYDRSPSPTHTIINKTEDGRCSRLYFNGYMLSDTQVRVYARLVLPSMYKATDTKKPPVIILLGTFDKDIDNIKVDFLSQQGYAVLLVDYAGNVGEKSRYTIYPKSLDAYWETSPEKIKLPPEDIKTSCWYYWTTCIFHAVTFLEGYEHVDSKKIGIFGIDQGAALVWKSSFCSEIKAGITFFSGDLMGSSEQLLAYKASLDSRAYAKPSFPILINAATNSSDGSFDYLSELFNASTNSAFCVYPCADRAFSPQQLANIYLWYDTIFSGLPALTDKHNLTVFGSGGAVYTEMISSADKVQIFYAEECSPQFRNWKEIQPPRAGEDKYLAKLDIFDIEKPILVFANLSFNNGFTFSTAVTLKTPTKLGAVKTDKVKSRLIYQSEMGTAEWLVSDYNADWPTLVEGPRELTGVCGDELITYKLGDSRFNGPGSLLQIMISAKEPQEVEIYLIDSAAEHKCSRKISAHEWSTLSLSNEDFKSAKGLPDFDKILGIKIKGQGIILNSLLWV